MIKPPAAVAETQRDFGHEADVARVGDIIEDSRAK